MVAGEDQQGRGTWKQGTKAGPTLPALSSQISGHWERGREEALEQISPGGPGLSGQAKGPRPRRQGSVSLAHGLPAAAPQHPASPHWVPILLGSLSLHPRELPG